MKISTFTAALLAATLLTPGLALAEGAHFTYAGEHGPDHWDDLDPANAACGVGTQQSPLDITGAIPAALDPIALNWQAGPGKIVNNGHTIQVVVPAGSTLTRGDVTYDLLQFHFHAASEHLIDGAAAAMEVHFVHKNPATGALGVLGVMIEAGAPNPAFAELAAAFPAGHEEEAELDAVDPNGLLPEGLGYFAYEGSLTTPPCSEVVDWMVLQSPITVDAADIAKFTALYSANARPVMDGNRRFILVSE